MKKCFLFFFIAIGLLSCQDREKNDSNQAKVKPIAVNDTIIGSKNITDEIAGSAYRKHAKSYFIIVDKDTSDFQPIWAEAKVGGNVSLFLNLPYAKRSITYRQINKELQKILPAAKQDFNFDSLKTISFGRLILSGDLAVIVSQEYLQKFGEKAMEEGWPSNKIYNFMQNSRLVQEVNTIFKPYSLSVETIYCEKAFFTTKKDLFWASKVETDSAKVPNRILDCILFVKLKKENDF